MVQSLVAMQEAASQPDITLLLNRAREGESTAADQLVPLVYAELRRLARQYLSNERRDHTLQPTALVNDALLKLLGTESIHWQNRAHFFGMAANQMRHILIDHARAHLADKRGGDLHQVTLAEGVVFTSDKWEELLAVDEALDRLQKRDERLAKIVEMRFFAGMTEEETAEALGISERTVKRDWKIARAWLYGELKK